MSEKQHQKWLKEFLKPLMPTFREVLAMSLFVNIIALAVPVFVLQVYDRVVFHAGLSTLQGLVIGIGFVLFFDYLLRQSRSRVMQTVALRVDVLVGRRLFEKFMELPLQSMETHPAAHWQALFRDVDIIRNTLSGASAVLVADLPFTFLFLGLVLIIAKPVAWVLLIIVPIFLIVAWRSGNVMAKVNQAERKTSMNRDGLIAEMIGGRTTIKALALDRAMRPHWEDKHADNIEQAISRGSKTDGYTNLGMTLTLMTTVSLTAVGALAIINQELTMGALIATNMLSGRLLGPLNQLVGQWRVFASYRQAVDRLGQIFEVPGERMHSEVQMERPKGQIAIDNLTFAYSPKAAPVIDGVQLTIKAGGVNALVGRNGSGKTTLLKLIQGLYKPSDGRVLLDGADINQFTRGELAAWIGYVPQESVLFAGTVRDNIVHRMPDADDEQIIKAATEAGVHDFIVDLPDGYGTEIGEAGRRLSGGQRQRIAIARALIGDPPVLLLDEPSSSLDRQAEIELRDTLSAIGTDRTVIIVTHSPILLAACQDLVALDKGRVAITGPAKDILSKLFGAQNPPPSPPAPSAPAPSAPTPSAPGPSHAMDPTSPLALNPMAVAVEPKK
jgi:ATP-binding cassette, subfamily C, bacterial LapB